MARIKQTARMLTGGKAPRRPFVQKMLDRLKAVPPPPPPPRYLYVMKPQPYPSGVVALREIRRYQKSTDLLIPKLKFQRLAKQIVQEMGTDMRFAAASIMALQEAAEAYMVTLFGDALLCMIHAKRRTLMTDDIKLVNLFRNKQ